MQYMIKAENVHRGFPVGGNTFWALRDINLTIPTGKLTILKGRSGSGKTTLLNILSALDVPTKGKVYIGETDVTALSDSGRDKLRRKQVGYVYQSVALIPMMTARTVTATLPQTIARQVTATTATATRPATAALQQLLTMPQQAWVQECPQL